MSFSKIYIRPHSSHSPRLIFARTISLNKAGGGYLEIAVYGCYLALWMTVVVYIMFRVSCVVVPVPGGTVFCLSVVCGGWRYNHVLGTSTKPLHITKRCLQAQSVTTQNNATRSLRSDLPLTSPPPPRTIPLYSFSVISF